MELVEVKRDVIFCDSSLVARKFNQKHNKVISVIQKLCDDLRGILTTPKFPIKEERNYQGRDYTAYLMGREFFSLLPTVH
jgi:phage regulator Rha-like protein